MDVEEIREGVLAILKELHEDIDFEAEDKMVEDKILDSFDLVTLVTELGEEFDVDITAKDFIAENFNSVDKMCIRDRHFCVYSGIMANEAEEIVQFFTGFIRYIC